MPARFFGNKVSKSEPQYIYLYGQRGDLIPQLLF
jgi:hypothetical protein